MFRVLLWLFLIFRASLTENSQPKFSTLPRLTASESLVASKGLSEGRCSYSCCRPQAACVCMRINNNINVTALSVSESAVSTYYKSHVKHIRAQCCLFYQANRIFETHLVVLALNLRGDFFFQTKTYNNLSGYLNFPCCVCSKQTQSQGKYTHKSLELKNKIQYKQ